MKRTPLEQLIDWAKSERLEADYVLSCSSEYDLRDVQNANKEVRFFDSVIKKATELLEEEKATVIDAFDNGAQEQEDWYSNPHGGTKTSEQYSNQTFTTNDH